MLGQFLRAMLPTIGDLAVVTIKNKVVSHHWAKTLEEVEALVLKYGSTTDTYIALSSFKSRSRKADNQLLTKDLWIDLDLKGSTYANLGEALKHTAEFCKAYSLPNPTIVYSGGGFHFHWPLDTELSHDAWHILASGLHNAATTFGLQFDVKCTRDAARILRVPGTTNFKYSNTPMAKVLGQVSPSSPLSAFDSIKGLGGPAKSASAKKAKPSSIGAMFTNDGDADFIAVNCDQIAHFKATGSDSEPHWYACANVLKHCKNGLERFLEWSSQYEGYDEAQARAKFLHASSTGTGPTLCSSFTSLRPDACKACQQLRNVTTPLHVKAIAGRASADNGVSITICSAEESDGEEVKIDLPPVLQPFILEDGLIKAPSSDKALQKSVVYESIVSCDIRIVKRLKIIGGAETYIFRVKEILETEYRELAIPASVAVGANKVSEFAKLGVTIYDVTLWNRYMRLSMDYLNPKRLPTPAYDTFGWQEDGTFIIGPWKYTEHGREKAELDPSIRERAKNLGTAPGGNIQGATRVLSRIMAQMSSNQILLYMLAMGAPLMRFLDIEEGGVVGWDFSHESGTGKSTTIETIEASIGKLGCVRMNERDTGNAKAALFGLMRSLPVTMDDPNPTDTGGINHIMDIATAGSDKNALNQDRTLRTQPHKWRTVFVAASNSNPFDIVETQRKRRIIGFHEPVKPYLDRSHKVELHAELRKHGGWIMHELMKFYIRKDVQDYARNKVNHWINLLDREYKFRSEDRFNVAAVAVALTSLEFVMRVAKDAGEPLHIDARNMLAVGVTAAKDSMETADSNGGGSATDIITSFLAENVSCTVTMHPSTNNNTTPKIDIPSGFRELKIMVEPKRGRIIIRSSAFSEWVKSKGRFPTEIIRELEREGRVIAKNRPTYMGFAGHVLGTQRCLIIKIEEKKEEAD